MARDPGEGEASVFDIVDDGGDVPSSPLGPDAGSAGGADGVGPDGAGPVAGRPLAHGMLGPRLSTLTPVAAVLAIALGTVFVVDGVRDSARMERMRDVRGGVVGVSSPMQETWAWEGEVGAHGTFADRGWTGVAALGDVLVFESDGRLVALDPASGEEVWTVPLGQGPECGPTGYPGWSEIATSALVCLQASGAGREVITVGEDGVASAPRALEAGDARRYGDPRPGPDATVLRARRVGPQTAVDLGTAECTGGGCTGTIEAGRDLLLRAEDAVTGGVRWNVTLPFRAMEAEACWAGQGVPWDGSRVVDLLDPDAFGAQIGADLVEVRGCGLRAAVTPDGVLLGTDGAPGSSSVFRLDTGGYVAQTIVQASDGTTNSVLFSPDGDVVGEIDGYVSRPETTDEPDAATLLATDRSGQHLLSYAADGTQRWDAAVEVGSPRFLAQVAGTAVTQTWGGTVHGLDLATGDRRWQWDPVEGLDDWPHGPAYVSRAFSDGQSVLLLLRGESRGTGLVSLDAASGALVWDGTATGVVSPSHVAVLVAVDGNLLEVAPDGVRGLG
ncbi:outer membrane protein assembly factor BamB family protein [Promicromonospora soli]